MQYRPNRTWLTTAFFLSVTLLVLHLYALQYHLYWVHRWFDIPMHIIGGAAIGAFIFAFGTGRRTFTFFFLLLVVFLVWKSIEHFGHISYEHPYDWLGNFKDLVTSFIGAFVPFVLGRKTSWR